MLGEVFASLNIDGCRRILSLTTASTTPATVRIAEMTTTTHGTVATKVTQAPDFAILSLLLSSDQQINEMKIRSTSDIHKAQL